MYDLIIKNGTIVTPAATYKADIAVSGGKIEAIGSASHFGRAKRKIDAGSCIVMAGIIDGHTHFESSFMGCRGSLDFYDGSVAAAFGGVTTFIDFSHPEKGKSVMQGIKNTRELMTKSCIDHSLHVKLVNAGEDALQEIKSIVEYGCPTIKMFMTYRKEGDMTEDENLFKVMLEARKWGALPGVHAESNTIAEANFEKFKAEGKLGWNYFAKAKPDFCELEAVQKAILFARYAGSPLYIFHLSSRLGLLSVKLAQNRGQRVIAETCPHYLCFTSEEYDAVDGHLFIMSPPLKQQEDVDAMWHGIRDGNITIIGSDNCSYSREDKERFLERDGSGNIIPDFTKVVNGVPGTEERLPLLLEEGVNKGRITLNKLCEITSYNPARTFGLYPQKGIIQVGSDADFVLIDMEKTDDLTSGRLHHKIDYSIYGGKKVKGLPVMTILRGNVIVEDGEFTGKRGDGVFTKRTFTSN